MLSIEDMGDIFTKHGQRNGGMMKGEKGFDQLLSFEAELKDNSNELAKLGNGICEDLFSLSC